MPAFFMGDVGWIYDFISCYLIFFGLLFEKCISKNRNLSLGQICIITILRLFLNESNKGGRLCQDYKQCRCLRALL